MSISASVTKLIMKRRGFLLSGGMLPLMGTAAVTTKAHIFELRLFRLRHTRDNMVQRTSSLLEAFVQAATRHGAEAPGVFSPVLGGEAPALYLLTGYDSLARFEQTQHKLAEDAAWSKALQGFAAGSLGYIRSESWLLRAFPSFPGIELLPDDKAPHLFELRTYASDNPLTLRRKIQMFEQGEIALFRKVGMKPVFFAETIAGSNQPNLTYLLAYDDWAQREQVWSAFINHPEWQKMKAQPGWSDAEIVSNISSVLLRPLPFSRIR